MIAKGVKKKMSLHKERRIFSMKINIPRHISISIAFVMIDKHRGVNQEE
jgi:hypothetical protein